MSLNTLNDGKCRSAKPSEKPYKLFDGGSLFLYVTPSGGKIWRCAYRVDGKQQTKSFGNYPLVSLADARKKRDELKLKLLDGVDPRVKKQDVPTFKVACDIYWTGRNDLSADYLNNAKRALEMHLFQKLGEVQIKDINREMLLSALKVMDARGLHVYVRKTRMWASQVFEWAIANNHAQSNPAALIDPNKTFGHSRVTSFAAIEPKEMSDFIQRLDMEKDLQSVLACRMLCYTWVRTTELRMMRWKEIDGNTWIIPAGKMKRGLDHVVPLSRQALQIIDEQKARCRGSDYVWPHDRRNDRPMSENAILYLIGRIGYKGRMTGHGFRSVASTWANENGYNEDAIERQLAHVPGDKIRAVYNRAAYMVERTKMLQDWADWVESFRQIDTGTAESGDAPA